MPPSDAGVCGDPRIVGDMGPEAAESVEEGGLAGVGLAQEDRSWGGDGGRNHDASSGTEEAPVNDWRGEAPP